MDAGDADALVDLVLELTDVGDDTDIAGFGDIAQDAHDVVEIVVRQGSEALVDEQGFHGQSAVLRLDDVGERQCQGERDEEGLASGQTAGRAQLFIATVEDVDGKTGFGAAATFMLT